MQALKRRNIIFIGQHYLPSPVGRSYEALYHVLCLIGGWDIIGNYRKPFQMKKDMLSQYPAAQVFGLSV
jgi:hypothetical protein